MLVGLLGSLCKFSGRLFLNWTTDQKVSVREKLTLSKTISLHICFIWRSCSNVLYVTRMPNQKKRFAYGINMELSGLNILIKGHVCSHSTVIISFVYLVCVLQILYVIFHIFYLQLRTFHIF